MSEIVFLFLFMSVPYYSHNLLIAKFFHFDTFYFSIPEKESGLQVILNFMTDIYAGSKCLLKWSRWWDSNPHAARHQILSLARLPVPSHPVIFWHPLQESNSHFVVRSHTSYPLNEVGTCRW